MINPLKPKYYALYMDMAKRVAEESDAKRRKVGAVIVTTTGMVGIGWNGMPAGLTNVCEWQCEDGKGYNTGKTKPEVIHAERNALDKLGRQGVPAKDAIVFITCAPCIECAKSLHAMGIQEVWYLDDYSKSTGVEFLNRVGVPCKKWLKEVVVQYDVASSMTVKYVNCERCIKGLMVTLDNVDDNSARCNTCGHEATLDTVSPYTSDHGKAIESFKQTDFIPDVPSMPEEPTWQTSTEDYSEKK